MDLSVGQKLSVTIEKLSLGGDGIARIPLLKQEPSPYANFVIFVPYTLPGEEAEIIVTDKRKTFARGRLIKILKAHPQRENPPCPYFFSPTLTPWCGGCNFQHIHYPLQLNEKEKLLKETLLKIGGIAPEIVLPVIGMPLNENWRYRNKIQIPFGQMDSAAPNDENVISGFFSPDSHKIVPIEDCLIHSEEMMALVGLVRKKMNELKIEAYSEKYHKGWLRNLIIRQEKSGGKMLALFVTLSDTFPHMEEWVREIRENFPNVSGIFQNINPEQTNVILGRKWKKIHGADHLVEELNGLGPNNSALKLKISASSFFQINTKMAETLYQCVRNFAASNNATGPKLLIDLYCGVGGIGLASASNFEKVIGVDETVSSIDDANANAGLNHISNCEFFCGDVKLFLKEFPNSTARSEAPAIIIDPPRAGCSEEILAGIINVKPQKIIYVSCEPSTLARDLKYLSSHRYRPSQIQPIDLFPQSSHIESVSLLEKEL